MGLLAALAPACRKPSIEGGAGASLDAAMHTSGDVDAPRRAADRRDVGGLAGDPATRRDVGLRRATAQALARIASPAAVPSLRELLSDEDVVTVAWAAYGLGPACKGNEDAIVAQLAARAASLGPTTSGADELDARVALARAVGRCGGALASETLRGWLEARPDLRRPAALGLGDLLTRHSAMNDRLATSLLEALSAKAPGPEDAVFYPLSRGEPNEAFDKRTADAARASLLRAGEWRILAIKTLARVSRETSAIAAATEDLARIVTDARGFTPAERAEAARALGKLGAVGASGASRAITALTSDLTRGRDARSTAQALGDGFGVLYTLLQAVTGEPPKSVEPALGTLSRLAAPTGSPPWVARRLADLRCQAALGLARGVSDADVLVQCDDTTTETSERVRLTSLLRRPLVRERRAAFRAFAQSKHLRIREQAVGALVDHTELGDAAAPILAEALASPHAGLVAAAAEALHVRPSLAMVLARSEIRAALDPKAPPPTDRPKQELAGDVAKALDAALARAWPEDRFETRVALVEAAAAVHHRGAKESALAACTDPNPMLRERAQKALRTLGEATAPCEHARAPTTAVELDHLSSRPVRIVFQTERGELGMTLDPSLSPVTVTRITSLVRAGFYKGIDVHRVVPGFVAQFGDPDGDGYGGAGTSLRCETSPVPFEPLNVGMALAGRDTGSSQLFVTLSRTPHLDGEYTWIGHADGDWAAVAQGDVIVDARVVE